MSTLVLDGAALVYKTPFSRTLVDALKTQIPATDRQWDGNAKAWRVALQHGALLVRLTEQYLGEHLTAPAVAVTSKSETRVLDVRYIGTTKDRGAGERTAFGWSENAWSVVLPEPVLRAWFAAPARPDEVSTLYQVLAVQPNATEAELKTAYRRLARQWHPDVCREPGATEIFKILQHAWEILSDPGKRARYNAGLALTATLGPTAPPTTEPLTGYRSPLRCGLLLAEGVPSLGRFVVQTILAWEDITNERGQVLSVSWPLGAERFVEVWL